FHAVPYFHFVMSNGPWLTAPGGATVFALLSWPALAASGKFPPVATASSVALGCSRGGCCCCWAPTATIAMTPAIAAMRNVFVIWNSHSAALKGPRYVSYLWGDPFRVASRRLCTVPADQGKATVTATGSDSAPNHLICSDTR